MGGSVGFPKLSDVDGSPQLLAKRPVRTVHCKTSSANRVRIWLPCGRRGQAARVR